MGREGRRAGGRNKRKGRVRERRDKERGGRREVKRGGGGGGVGGESMHFYVS